MHCIVLAVAGMHCLLTSLLPSLRSRPTAPTRRCCPAEIDAYRLRGAADAGRRSGSRPASSSASRPKASASSRAIRRSSRSKAGVARPVGNGTGHDHGSLPGGTAAANGDRRRAWNSRSSGAFAITSSRVLAKTGCNSGACHGALGRQERLQAFAARLRSRGRFSRHHPQQARGRRVVLERSGPQPAADQADRRRFRTKAACGSSSIRSSIACWPSGLPPACRRRKPADPRIERLEILPPGVVLQPGAKQQLLVLAHFTDGHVEDVTRWAKYTSTNESVATVDDDGLVTVVGYGEGGDHGLVL